MDGLGSTTVNDGTKVISLNISTGEFEWKLLTAVHIHVPAFPVVSTTLYDGRQITMTADHSLFTLTSDCSFIETSIASEPSTIISAYKLPCIEDGVNIDPDMAFLIGISIGDGNLADNNGIPNSSIRIGAKDVAVRDRISKILPKYGKPAVVWRDNKHGLMVGNFSTINLPYITDIGRGASNKHIPVELLSASDKVLIELLDGLLSSDGNLSRNRYEFTTTSETLASQVQFISLRLGLQFGVEKRSTVSNFNRNHPTIRVRFNALSSRKIKVTHSGRQLNLSKPVGSDQTNHDFTVIRPALVNEFGTQLWKESNAFQRKNNRIKHEHLELMSKYIPMVYNKVKNVLPMEVKSIANVETPKYVYDVSVADNGNFVLANGIVAVSRFFVRSAFPRCTSHMERQTCGLCRDCQ